VSWFTCLLSGWDIKYGRIRWKALESLKGDPQKQIEYLIGRQVAKINSNFSSKDKALETVLNASTHARK